VEAANVTFGPARSRNPLQATPRRAAAQRNVQRADVTNGNHSSYKLLVVISVTSYEIQVTMVEVMSYEIQVTSDEFAAGRDFRWSGFAIPTLCRGFHAFGWDGRANASQGKGRDCKSRPASVLGVGAWVAWSYELRDASYK